MQTRGVRGQKIPKNANIICERPRMGDTKKSFWFYLNFKLLSLDDFDNNGRFSCKNEIENMSPPIKPKIKHFKDGSYRLTLSLVTLFLSKKPDWKIVHCTV